MICEIPVLIPLLVLSALIRIPAVSSWELSFKTLPECAISCPPIEPLKIGCSYNDIACVCRNEKAVSEFVTCIQDGRCNEKDSAGALGLAMDLCFAAGVNVNFRTTIVPVVSTVSTGTVMPTGIPTFSISPAQTTSSNSTTIPSMNPYKPPTTDTPIASPTPSQSRSSSSKNVLAIGLSVALGVMSVTIILFSILFLRRRRQLEAQSHYETEERPAEQSVESQLPVQDTAPTVELEGKPRCQFLGEIQGSEVIEAPDTALSRRY